jgi:hypothetical protein
MERYPASRLPKLGTRKYPTIETVTVTTSGILGILIRWQERVKERQRLS